MANRVRQGLPFANPGFQLGIMRATRKASRSSIGFTDLAIFRSLVEPSRLMMNVTTTRP